MFKSLCLQHCHDKQCVVQNKSVLIQWQYVKTILCLQCFYNKWIEYLHVHLLLNITIFLKLEHHFESMLNNKIGDWIKEQLIFSWKITFPRSFLSGFTGKYCLPGTVLKVIISLYVNIICTLSVSLVKKEGGGNIKN